MMFQEGKLIKPPVGARVNFKKQAAFKQYKD
jgi:hypothetical protein